MNRQSKPEQPEMPAWKQRLTGTLTGINICVSFVVWLPAHIRIITTHSARDYSMLTMLLILFLQVSNLTIAIAEKARKIAAYMTVNTAIVVFTCCLVWWFQR